MQDHFVDSAGGARIHVREYGGAPDATPLLMVHSTGFGAWMWAPMADDLARRFRLYAVDQRGHGDSSTPDTGYDFDIFAADIEAVCAALGLRDFAGLGHSAGATTLLHHAAHQPGRTRALLLVEPILPMDPSWQPGDGSPSASTFAERTRKRKPSFASADEMFESFRPRPPFSSWREDILRLYCEEGTRRADGGILLKTTPEAEARHYEAVARYNAREALQSARVPLRLVWGENGVRGRDGRGFDETALPASAETRIVAGASHFLPMERPEVIVEQALDFFGEERD